MFGNLATVFVLVEYLFGVSVIFLGGAVIDQLMRKRHGSGAEEESSSDGRQGSGRAPSTAPAATGPSSPAF